MNISIYEAWVVYYTMESFSPSLAIDVMFTSQAEAEAALLECENEDKQATTIFPINGLKYHVVTIDEWIRVKSDYQYRMGEQNERQWNESQ